MKLKLKKILILVLLVLFVKPVICYAQQIVNLQGVDLIIYNEFDADFRLYKQNDKDKFVEIYIEIDTKYDEDNKFYFTSIELKNSDDYQSLDEIFNSNDEKLIYTTNLRKTNIDSLLNLTFEIKETKYYKEGKENNKLVLKFLTPYSSVIQEFYFGEKENIGGFGSFSTKQQDDKIERWRVYYANFFSIIDLNFGNDKHLFLLNNDQNTDFIFFPLKKENFLISNDDGLGKLITTKEYSTTYIETFNRLNFEDFTSTYKNKDNKYELVNIFKKKLIETGYDTIIFNQFYTIAKKDNQFDIFNSFYKKIKLGKIKSAYLYRSGLEILNKKGANYYDSELNVIEKFPPLSYTVCGTVSDVTYKIDYNKQLKKNILTKIYGGFGTGIDEKRKYFLDDIKTNMRVSFVDDSNKQYWDENDSFVGSIWGFPHFIKVSKKNRYGIYEYSYDDNLIVKDTIKKEWKKEIRFNPKKIKGKKVLPIRYDSIVMNYSDGLIYFYKKKKIGIFPKDKTVQYDKIKQITKSFYSIERKRKKGWLDVKTNKEYIEK